jgi:hypothetical protein
MLRRIKSESRGCCKVFRLLQTFWGSPNFAELDLSFPSSSLFIKDITLASSSGWYTHHHIHNGSGDLGSSAGRELDGMSNGELATKRILCGNRETVFDPE